MPATMITETPDSSQGLDSIPGSDLEKGHEIEVVSQSVGRSVAQAAALDSWAFAGEGCAKHAMAILNSC